MLSTSIDRSSLAALIPAQPLEFKVKSLKNSMRLQGSHLMALRKPNRMPESSRTFVQGDPVNLIDWKAYARNDQLIIRERRDEASARIEIFIDAGETMCWPNAHILAHRVKHGNKENESARVSQQLQEQEQNSDEIPEPSPEQKQADSHRASGRTDTSSSTVSKHGIPTKLELASRLAFNLAHLHLRCGDSVEIWIAPDTTEGSLPILGYKPRSPSDVLGAFTFLEKARFTKKSLLSFFETTQYHLRRTDCFFWVGDCLSGAAQERFLAQAKLKTLIHTLSSLETDISWLDSTTSYYDGIDGGSEYMGAYLNRSTHYQSGVDVWRASLEKRMRKSGGRYLLATDKTSISSYLTFLVQIM